MDAEHVEAWNSLISQSHEAQAIWFLNAYCPGNCAVTVGADRKQILEWRCQGESGRHMELARKIQEHRSQWWYWQRSR